jgi:sporulation protein YlmC with PRC-barrel domain
VHLSDVQRWRVVSESGEELGRVYDLRARGRPARGRSHESAPVTTVVYGVSGLLERLGVRRGARCEIDWTDVVALRGDRLIVRDDARISR